MVLQFLNTTGPKTVFTVSEHIISQQYEQFRRWGQRKGKINIKRYNTNLKSNTTYKYYYGDGYIESIDIVREKSIKKRPIIAKKKKKLVRDAISYSDQTLFRQLIASNCGLLLSD